MSKTVVYYMVGGFMGIAMTVLFNNPLGSLLGIIGGCIAMEIYDRSDR